MSFDLYDFSEILDAAGVDIRVEHCSLGFGSSREGGGAWEGGFVCHTRSGKPWLFVFGRCGYPSYDGQDGAWIVEFDKEPTHEEIKAAWGTRKDMTSINELLATADKYPLDVNRYLSGEINKYGGVEHRVSVLAVGQQRPQMTYQAVCYCGWRGDRWPLRPAARMEGDEHATKAADA